MFIDNTKEDKRQYHLGKFRIAPLKDASSCSWITFMNTGFGLKAYH